jgi:phospholipid/cholesterol/gamma-HCH transport system substrate-binding protein
MIARVLAICALLGGALALILIGRDDEPSVHVEAVVRDARGLVNGASVTVGGIEVGHVDDVRLGADGYPHVRMTVRRDVGLRHDARAAVRLASQSGEFNRYVALAPGSGAPARAPIVLGLARTAAPVEIDQALSALDPHTRADLRATLRGLRGALDASGPADARTLKSAPAALTQLAGVLDDVSADGAALRTLVSSSRQLAAALAGRPARLQALLRSSRTLLQTTAARESQLRDSLAQLPAGLRAPRTALATTRAAIPDLRALIADARPLTTRLAPTARELRATLSTARPALAQARRLTQTAPTDLRALTPLLREATPLVKQLSPLLARINPMLDQTRVRLPDFFSFFSNWADFTGNYDANGHGARVGIVLPPAPTNVLAPSSNGAGQLRPPYLRTPGSLEGDPWKDYAQSFVGGGTAGPDVNPPKDPVVGR